jgi:hypothetical protein
VRVIDGDGVIVFEKDGLGVSERVTVRVTDGDRVIVLETDSVGVSDRLTVRVIEGDFVIVLETDSVGVSERLTVLVTDGDRVIVLETDELGVSERVTDGVFVGRRLLENDGSFVGRGGMVGNAVLGKIDGNIIRVGSSVAGSSIPLGSSVKRLGRGRIDGYSVIWITTTSVGRAVFTILGIEGYSDLKISGTDGNAEIGISVLIISGTDGYSGTDGISVRRVGSVLGIDPAIDGNSNEDGIIGIVIVIVGTTRGGIDGSLVEGMAGNESVGSIEGS